MSQMKTLRDQNGLSRCNLWIGELPKVHFDPIDHLAFEIKATPDREYMDCCLALEMLLLPRIISNYALLGLDYGYEPDERLVINVAVSEDRWLRYEPAMTLAPDEGVVGIPREYANAILRTACDFFARQDIVPSGRLFFHVGAHALAGSSQKIFSRVTQVVLALLLAKLNDSPDGDLENIALNEMHKGFTAV